MTKRIYILFFGLVFLFVKLQAQSLAVGQLGLDEAARNLQLMGGYSNQLSFNVKPIYQFDNDSLLFKLDSSAGLSYKKVSFGKSTNGFTFLPFVLTTKFNSHHPFGWNDQGMIAAKGLQNQISAGIFLKYGPLTVQLQPEYVTASNPNFESNLVYGSPTNGKFSKIYAGQSSVRLNAGAFSFGYSTENLWWGPGQYSALMLSNNAPGFEHFTFNTRRPIKTPIGSFEFQLIGGKLNEDSGNGGLYQNLFLQPKNLSNDWRYLNAMVVSYQPRFLKGFFLGATRAFQLYETDFKLQTPNIIQKYLPVFTALFKNGTSNEDAINRDQQVSLFARWLLEKANAEFYFEFGYNDHSANMRDFVLDPVHSAAYIVGAKKLVPLNNKKWLELNCEITQMAQSSDFVVRDAGNWYVHSGVDQGMTNQQKILGAGSGEGNNVQTFSASWLNGIKKLGLKFQRVQQDPKGFGGAYGGPLSSLYLREYPWNDVSIGLLGRWNFKRFLATAELQEVFSKNYGWQDNTNRTNFYGHIQISYLW